MAVDSATRTPPASRQTTLLDIAATFFVSLPCRYKPTPPCEYQENRVIGNGEALSTSREVSTNGSPWVEIRATDPIRMPMRRRSRCVLLEGQLSAINPHAILRRHCGCQAHVILGSPVCRISFNRLRSSAARAPTVSPEFVETHLESSDILWNSNNLNSRGFNRQGVYSHAPACTVRCSSSCPPPSYAVNFTQFPSGLSSDPIIQLYRDLGRQRFLAWIQHQSAAGC